MVFTSGVAACLFPPAFRGQRLRRPAAPSGESGRRGRKCRRIVGIGGNIGKPGNIASRDRQPGGIRREQRHQQHCGEELRHAAPPPHPDRNGGASDQNQHQDRDDDGKNENEQAKAGIGDRIGTQGKRGEETGHRAMRMGGGQRCERQQQRDHRQPFRPDRQARHRLVESQTPQGASRHSLVPPCCKNPALILVPRRGTRDKALPPIWPFARFMCKTPFFQECGPSCHTIHSDIYSASPPSAKATAPRSAAWSTAVRREFRWRRRKSRPFSTCAAPASPASLPKGRSPTR